MSPTPDISRLLSDEEAVRARRDALVREAAGASRRRGPDRARRTLIAVAALLVVGGGAAWAAGVFSADDVAVNAGVACYDRPSLHADASIFIAAADPVAKCAKFWREGVIDTRLRRLEREGKIPVRPHRATPHLVACTRENGGVYVFPGPAGVCSRLGLVPLPVDYAPRATAHARAYRAWYEIEKAAGWHQLGLRAEKSECVPLRDAAADTRRRLARLDAVHSAVPVTIEGGGRCAKELRVVGGRIAVIPVSRREERQQSLTPRGERALQGLVDSIGRRCLGFVQVSNRAVRLLRAAGLREVTFTTFGEGPCATRLKWSPRGTGFLSIYLSKSP